MRAILEHILNNVPKLNHSERNQLSFALSYFDCMKSSLTIRSTAREFIIEKFHRFATKYSGALFGVMNWKKVKLCSKELLLIAIG